jgi:hypothetical protein
MVERVECPRCHRDQNDVIHHCPSKIELVMTLAVVNRLLLSIIPFVSGILL